MAACCCAHPSLSWDLDIPAMFHDRNTELIPISCRASSLPLTPSHAPKLLQSYACFSSPTALLLSYPKFLSSAEVFKPQGWQEVLGHPFRELQNKTLQHFLQAKAHPTAARQWGSQESPRYQGTPRCALVPHAVLSPSST